MVCHGRPIATSRGRTAAIAFCDLPLPAVTQLGANLELEESDRGCRWIDVADDNEPYNHLFGNHRSWVECARIHLESRGRRVLVSPEAARFSTVRLPLSTPQSLGLQHRPAHVTRVARDRQPIAHTSAAQPRPTSPNLAQFRPISPYFAQSHSASRRF